METKLSAGTKEVIISDKRPTILVGERINATGKNSMAEALKKGDMSFLKKEALAQVEAGADVLDVNVGVGGVDEVDLLPRLVQAIMGVVEMPLCLESNNKQALEAALKVYRGKPLINSLTGEEQSLNTILPIIKEYDAVVIGLVMDDDGIPNDSNKRVAIAHKIVERADMLGIPRENIIIDCLQQSVGMDPRAAIVSLETSRKVKEELGLNLTIGASDCSFGLPDRILLNNVFIAMAIAAGVNCFIADVGRVRPIVLAADLIMGRDEYAKRYIEAYRKGEEK